MQAKLPAACACSVEAVSPVDAGEASGGTRSRQAAVFRLTRASGRCQDVRGVPRPAQQEALVRLRQAPVRGPEGRARLSVTLHPPCRNLEQPSDRSRPAQRHVQGQGLQDRRPRPIYDDDARHRRVHPPVPDPRAAQGLPSHPPLRLVRQREPRRDDRASARTPGTGNGCGRRGGRNRSGSGAATRPALPPLWRPHVRHRDLRGRLPTSLPADGNEDRYLMSETAAFRTPTTKRFPRWSITGYAAARPNTSPALHSAPRASPKRIVNATQAKPTSAHPQPRDQISIARGSRPTPPHARSFTGGFRTTATVQAASSRVAVIRNPSQQRKYKSSLEVAPSD